MLFVQLERLGGDLRRTAEFRRTGRASERRKRLEGGSTAAQEFVESWRAGFDVGLLKRE